jgi:hypothetical protein
MRTTCLRTRRPKVRMIKLGSSSKRVGRLNRILASLGQDMATIRGNLMLMIRLPKDQKVAEPGLVRVTTSTVDSRTKMISTDTIQGTIQKMRTSSMRSRGNGPRPTPVAHVEQIKPRETSTRPSSSKDGIEILTTLQTMVAELTNMGTHRKKLSGEGATRKKKRNTIKTRRTHGEEDHGMLQTQTTRSTTMLTRCSTSSERKGSGSSVSQRKCTKSMSPRKTVTLTRRTGGSMHDLISLRRDGL